MKDGKYVILYVDDDQDMLDTLKLVGEGAGYIVETASSAEKGLHAYKRTEPDLILIDLMMEEVDSGTQLVKDLKLLENTAPVYVLSSVGDQLNQATNYEDLGLSGVFQKPLSVKTLIATMRAKLG